MPNDALKPCPFCGGDKLNAQKTDMGKGMQTSTVMCRACKAEISVCALDAETRWNTRADCAPVDVCERCKGTGKWGWSEAPDLYDCEDCKPKAALAKNGCCDIDPDRCAGMCEDAVKALDAYELICSQVPSAEWMEKKCNERAKKIRAALTPVDVEGLKETIISWAFAECQPNKGDVFGWLDDNIDGLINHLAARGCFWGWQPIETAPKDGTWIMVYWPTMGIGQYPFVVFWDEGWQPARYSDRDYGEAFPTHWMPLPAAPKKEGM